MSISIDFKGHAVNLYDMGQLVAFHNKTKPVDTFILDTFFPNKLAFPNVKGVMTGDLDTVQPLAPFVDYNAKSRTVGGGGAVNSEFIPAAYLKPNRPITPDTVYDTALLATLQQAGAIGTRGNMSDGEKMLLAQVHEFNVVRESIANRKLLMAVDILTTGKTVYEGIDYARVEVDFKRDADLNFTPATAWNAGGADPVGDIETMLELNVDANGTDPVASFSSSKVFAALAANDKFKERFVASKSITSDSPVLPVFNRTRTAQLRGTFDGIQFWTYDATHNLGGSGQRFIAEDAFYLISDTNGYQCQCGIQNLDALGQPLEFYDYMTVEKDPSLIKLITESAPVIAPSMKNGVIGGTGFVQ